MNVPDLRKPAILWEFPDLLVCYKPGGMATAPLRGDATGTLLEWVGQQVPEVLLVSGRSPHEGGLAHRLDTATSGLVVVARSSAALQKLMNNATAGGFCKEYHAQCTESSANGLSPEMYREWPFLGSLRDRRSTGWITTAFRPYGPGRRRVAPVTSTSDTNTSYPGGQRYTTQILAMKRAEDQQRREYTVHVALTRGFRHQVRVHLSAMGLPINGDWLYGGVPDTALRLLASSVIISDPRDSRKPRTFRIQQPTVEGFFNFT
jgi:23S rRNA pseudouridine1911/1915/1917 synthase